MRKIAILGATGSIGSTVIKTIRENNPGFFITGLTSNRSRKVIDLAKEFSCSYFLTEGKTREEIKEYISNLDADIVLNAIAGSDGLFATVCLIEAHIDIALANKESIVLGGNYIFSLAEKNNVRIIPVDSEHSCIYSLISAFSRENTRKLIITASGGPFYKKSTENVSLDDALNHPTWKMGKKITIDSATLANKGLEVIEAGYLFSFDADDIKVTIHRQSIVHSLIELKNGAVYAQLTPPDMSLPIASALSDGKIKLENIVSPLSFEDLTLTFSSWSKSEFPLLAAAYSCLENKGSYPCVFNIADEVAVDAFISGRISFNDISRTVLKVLEKDYDVKNASLEETDYLSSLVKEDARKLLDA